MNPAIAPCRRAGLLAVLVALLLAVAAPARPATEAVRVTSPGGITAWLVQDDTIPMVAIDALFRGGALLDPADRPGVTTLMASLLDEGAGERDAQAFARARERLGARISISGGATAISVSAQFLTETRAGGAALLADALTAPRFAPDAVERARGQRLSSLRADARDAGTLAARAFDRLMYPDHPLARPARGTVETVAALTRADIVAAHARAFARDRLIVGVAGDISPQALGKLLDGLFGDLPASGPALPDPAEVPATPAQEVVALPGPQATARFGQPGLPRDDPDFLAAYLMNHILGGGPQSRLTKAVREERGLTYNVSTALDPEPLGPLLAGGVSSANATIAEALQVIRAEWRRMARNGATAEELAAARTYLTGSYPLRFTGNGRIAAILAGFQAQGLPIGYLTDRNALIEAVTLADVNRVAARLLTPEALRIVVVGRPEGLPRGD